MQGHEQCILGHKTGPVRVQKTDQSGVAQMAQVGIAQWWHGQQNQRCQGPAADKKLWFKTLRLTVHTIQHCTCSTHLH